MAYQITNISAKPLALSHEGQLFTLEPDQTRLVPGERLDQSQRLAQLAGLLASAFVADSSSALRPAEAVATPTRVDKSHAAKRVTDTVEIAPKVEPKAAVNKG